MAHSSYKWSTASSHHARGARHRENNLVVRSACEKGRESFLASFDGNQIIIIIVNHRLPMLYSATTHCDSVSVRRVSRMNDARPLALRHC
eukprot:5702552-Prymnesium_polylepis.1